MYIITEGRWCFLDNIKERVAWHPGFFSGMKLTLRENKEDLDFQAGQELNQEPLKTDMLIIEKKSGVEIRKTIGHIFRKHNILEYKGIGDELNIDTLHKLIAYTTLYKSQGEHVNAIPGAEITASMCRNEYPQKLFEDLQELDVTIEERYPGIYYLHGMVYFPMQIVIFKRLNPEEYPELTMLNRDVAFDDFRKFIEQEFLKQGDRTDASAFARVILAGNPGLLNKLKEDQEMDKILEAFFSPEYKQEVIDEKTLEYLKSLMKKKKWNAEEAMDALSIPPAEQAKYANRL